MSWKNNVGLKRSWTGSIFLFLFLFVSQASGWAGSGRAPFTPETVPCAPDYSRGESWLALPETPGRKAVDLFWVYPTVYMDESGWIMDISDPGLKAAAHETIQQQASAFTGQANLYAPLYRQMNMAGLSLSKERRDLLMRYGHEDVWNAFRYYLDHYNNGRPFILAGHSQGSNLLTALAVEHWGKTGVEDQLVAGYLIGWSITGQDLEENPELRICRSPDQTGCFITYNTVAAGRQGNSPTIAPGTVVVNPLSWTVDSALAPAAMNLGAVFFGADGTRRVLPGFTSARAVDGGLVVDPADPVLVTPEKQVFPKGVYHAYDYALFYENLKANLARRIRAWGGNEKWTAP